MPVLVWQSVLGFNLPTIPPMARTMTLTAAKMITNVPPKNEQ